MCEGKERFLTFGLADRVARTRKKGINSARHAYKCAECGGFHVGTLVGRRRRERGESYFAVRDDEVFA